MLRLLLLAAVLASGWWRAGAAQAQATLNLGLEPGANHGHPLALWARSRAPGVQVQFDSTVYYQGRGSLRLLLENDEEPRFIGLYTTALPLDSLRGQLVTVSGWVRTRNFRGRAGVYAFAHNATAAGDATNEAMSLDSLPADTDWRRLEVRLPVKAIASGFGVGLRVRGNGYVWLDDLRVQANGCDLGRAPVPITAALYLTPAEALATNWDFERPLPRPALPDARQATAALDSAQPAHGRRYLRLARVGSTGPPPTLYLGTLPLAPATQGQTLRVTGHWRQPAGGPAVADNSASVAAFPNGLPGSQASSPGAAGAAPRFAYTLLSTDQGSSYHNDSPTGWGASDLQLAVPLPAPGLQWAAFAFDVPVPNDYARLEALAISLVLPAGVVELDDVRFAVGGQPYVPAPPPVLAAPTAAEAAWLRTALRPLRLDAPATDFQELAPLGSLLGPARLVGVGEVTQGSHEVAALRARLLRYLVSQRGFTGLLLLADPTASATLNDYLQTGQGDPARLLPALNLEGGATTELLEVVRWLRAYNQAHPGGRVLLAGLDMRQPDPALTQFAQTLAASDDFAQVRVHQLHQLLATLAHRTSALPDLRHHPDQPQDSLLPALRRLTTELAAGLDLRAKLLRGQPTSGLALARQRYYLRLIEQGATYQRLPPELATDYRAACLAENAQTIGQLAGAPKLVVWASNAQVAAASGPDRSLGQWLRATCGAGYQALGVALGQGRYTAWPAEGAPTVAALAAAPPGAYEAWLRTGPPAFLLPLGHLELTDATTWLFQQQLLRDAGARPTTQQFGVHDLRGEFDAVLFLRDSSPATPLP